MSCRRALLLLASIGLALSSLSTAAWAHPGHDGIGGPLPSHTTGAPDRPEGETASHGAAGSWAQFGHKAPSAAALVAAAVALLTTILHRRRALAVALVLVLAAVSFEGTFHAVLHLHHVRHADSLAIGASPAQQTAADLDMERPGAVPDTLLVEVAERYDPPATDVVVASNRGRAPPISPA